MILQEEPIVFMSWKRKFTIYRKIWTFHQLWNNWKENAINKLQKKSWKSL